MSCIFEWRQEWGKDPNRPEKTYPHAIVPVEPVMVAGVWEPDEHHGRAYSMLTTDAPESTKHVHERLPLFVPQPMWDEYLYSKDPPAQMLEPYAGDLDVFACENVLLKDWHPGPPKRT